MNRGTANQGPESLGKQTEKEQVLGSKALTVVVRAGANTSTPGSQCSKEERRVGGREMSL